MGAMDIQSDTVIVFGEEICQMLAGETGILKGITKV
jgi:hypothetical protein